MRPASGHGAVGRVVEVAEVEEVLELGRQEAARTQEGRALGVELPQDTRLVGQRGLRPCLRRRLLAGILHRDVHHILLALNRVGCYLAVPGRISVRGRHCVVRVGTVAVLSLRLLPECLPGRKGSHLL